MKKLFTLALFCLLETALFGSVTLVQSTDAFTSTGTAVIASFSSNTGSGSTLLCTAAISIVSGSAVVTPTIALPSTPGFTWTLLTTNSFQFGTYAAETVAVYGISNAGAMASTVETTVTPTVGSGTVVFGAQLLEVSGGVGVLDGAPLTASGNAPTPAAAGNLTTVGASDFILCFVTDPFYNTEFVQGIGYTSISTGGVGSGYGLNQYQIATPGTYPTAYGLSISGGWAMVALALKAPVSAVPRRRGSIF